MTAGVTVTSITMGAFTGTLDTNGQTVTLSGIFQISGTGTRTLTLGSSAISASQWSALTPTNLTFNANTSTITLSGSGQSFGGLTYATVILTGNVSQSLSGSNTFTNLTITGGASKIVTASFGGNQTVSGTFTVNGNSAINRVLVRSDTRGTARTITAATVTVTNADFQDIVGAGAGSWNLSAITGGSGDCGGNSGITFTTGATQYWYTATTGAKTWSTAGNWYLGSGGTGGAGRVPLPQDTARFDSASIGATSTTVTQDMPRIGSVDWTGVTNTPTWTTSTAASFFGSITLASGMTLTASSQGYTYEGRGASTLTSAGKSWSKAFTILCVGGSITLGDALTLTGSALALSGGSFDDGGFNVTIANLAASNSTTRSLTMGASTWTLTGTSGTSWATTGGGMTFNAGTSTIRYNGTRIAAQAFDGAGRTYYRFEDATSGAFALQFKGANTFTDGIYVDASAAARTILFTAGTTTTVGGMTRDAGTNVITLGSITAASHTLTKSGGGTITMDFMSISRSTATPGSTWYATNSTDGGNNSGWNFVVIAAATAPSFSWVAPDQTAEPSTTTTGTPAVNTWTAPSAGAQADAEAIAAQPYLSWIAPGATADPSAFADAIAAEALWVVPAAPAAFQVPLIIPVSAVSSLQIPVSAETTLTIEVSV